MVTKTEPTLKIADLVWVAMALLHREHPERTDFSKKEIQERAMQEDAETAARPGISLHISTHCVASKSASPAKHKMLTRTRAGRRRLYREGDDTHADRQRGATCPLPEDLPEKYQSLIDWYRTEYNSPQENREEKSNSEGATAETLMRLMGRITREDADEMIRIINDCCGRVDANEW